MGPPKPPSKLKHFFVTNFTSAPLYPLKGMYYFASHRYLHPLLVSRLIPLTLLSLGILALLFLTAYLPLVAFLALFHYKGSAWLNATVFILGIGTLAVSMLFEALFVDYTQVDIFDAVMVAEGYEHLVRSRRAVSDDINEASPHRRLGPREKGATFAPFSFRQIIEFVFLLPLNFIPFVGIPLFLLGTGYRAGPLLQWRYYALKGFSKAERNAFIKMKSHRWEYMWFGTAYMILQLVPGLSMLFLLTSAAGSALWAVRLERESGDAVLAEDEEQRLPGYSDEGEV